MNDSITLYNVITTPDQTASKFCTGLEEVTWELSHFRGRNYVENLGFLSEIHHSKLGFHSGFGVSECRMFLFPMSIPIFPGFRSEILVKILGFHHYFWVSRKSANPVISLPAFH